VISPEELVERYGADPLRYFLLREVPFGEDGNFSPSLFIKRVNSDLANDLGNLLNRTLPLVERYCEGKVPCPAEERAEDAELREEVRQVVLRLDELMNELAFSEALSLIWEIIRFANLYIDRSAPWRLAKEGKKERLSTVLYYLLETLRVVSLLVFPFIPRSAERIWAQLGLEDKLSEKRWDEVERWGILPSGIRVRREAPLFPRIKE